MKAFQHPFTQLLMNWHEHLNHREMPWKAEKDPYKIWLSEVILQQTRVEQGLPYYQRFLTNYPTIQQLAGAKEEAVFKLWEGLGYYNRCKNLIETARYITNELNGIFPSEYDALVGLKGIGPYTASAIASFAFDKPCAVLDGNVFRVLSRIIGIDTPIDSTAGKKQFAQIAFDLLDKAAPALYNQAIMDFGATVCKPMLPLCGTCPLSEHCVAFGAGMVNKLPIKEKTLTKRNRWFYYFVLEFGSQVMVQKRTTKDIWENLFEFHLLEATERVEWDEATIKDNVFQQFSISDFVIVGVSGLQKQQLTHQLIKGQFIWIRLPFVPKQLSGFTWHPIETVTNLAFPRFITQYLDSLNTSCAPKLF